jgi:hypothetical protein
MRFIVGTFRTRERAEEVLEDMFANGEISEGEKPRIEPTTTHRMRGAERKVRYAITQEG